MKLVCLNTWGGKLQRPLASFVKRFRETTDIFCFQEVFSLRDDSNRPTRSGVKPNLYEKLAALLKEFQGYQTQPYSTFGERLAIFVKSTNVSSHGDVIVCNPVLIEANGEKVLVSSRLQWVTVRHGDPLTIANVHGLWLPSGKNDSPERIEQSRKIARFLEARKGRRIVCGDFNLLPDTRSIRILEDLGMTNLVKRYSVTSTRSHHYATGKEKFADYIFTSPEVVVRNFKVLEHEVSDHLPLLLEFN